MSEREPIQDVIDSDKASVEQKQKLQLIEKVKIFSEQHLGLKKTKNYQHFVQLNSHLQHFSATLFRPKFNSEQFTIRSFEPLTESVKLKV